MAAIFSNELGRQKEWHVGEPLPDFIQNSRVLKISVDCDELDWLKALIEKSKRGE